MEHYLEKKLSTMSKPETRETML